LFALRAGWTWFALRAGWTWFALRAGWTWFALQALRSLWPGDVPLQRCFPGPALLVSVDDTDYAGGADASVDDIIVVGQGPSSPANEHDDQQCTYQDESLRDFHCFSPHIVDLQIE